MKWRVEAIFTSRGFIEVEADSEEEAWEKAEDMVEHMWIFQSIGALKY